MALVPILGYTDNRAAMFLLPDQPYLGHARKVM